MNRMYVRDQSPKGTSEQLKAVIPGFEFNLKQVDAVIVTGGPATANLLSALSSDGFKPHTTLNDEVLSNVKGCQKGGFFDPKADPEIKRQMVEQIRRSTLYSNECERRGVRFLPAQVLRAAFRKNGVPDGKYDKSLQARLAKYLDF